MTVEAAAAKIKTEVFAVTEAEVKGCRRSSIWVEEWWLFGAGPLVIAVTGAAVLQVVVGAALLGDVGSKIPYIKGTSEELSEELAASADQVHGRRQVFGDVEFIRVWGLMSSLRRTVCDHRPNGCATAWINRVA